ncbi:GNAT family N-acetyltransferase [Chitinimonas sp.]|uniref:GNAT family N-acetyltransferase n=1 Tax=Chitinimonas sp. TaxID=1934313 RepID=UPI0035B0ABCE
MDQSVSLHPFTEAERPLLRALAELYSYDFSEMTGWALKENGLFLDEEKFQRYFIDIHRAFLIRHGGVPAGFAMVDNKSQLDGREGVHDVLQFFVLRSVRRHGVGARAAHALFDRFPGSWEVRQIAENTGAQAFWRRAIGDYTAGNYQESTWQDEDGSGVVQSFKAPAAP